MRCDEDRGIGAADRRLWRRLRLAMISVAVTTALVFLGMQVITARVVERYEEKALAIAGLERAAILAERLAIEALEVRSAASPAHRMVALGGLERAYRAFREAWRKALAAPGSDASDLRAVVEEEPHALAARLARFEAVGARLAGAGASGEAEGLARRLSRLADDDLQTAFAALREGHRVAARRTLARSRIAGFALAAVAGAALLLQWLLGVRPLLRRMHARTRQLRLAHEEVRRSLMFDGLTGLANRRNLAGQIARWPADTRVAVLHVDLLGVHNIGVTCGWETRDRLLRIAARTLGEVALAEEVVARADQDSFLVMTLRRTQTAQLQEMAVEIVRSLARPVTIGSRTLVVDAVVGIAVRGAAEGAETLISNAELACAGAREEGGAVYFSTGRGARLAARRRTAQDLLEALACDEIEPHFQPQIEAATGAITGFEALARWRHREKGLLSPFFFLDQRTDLRIGQRITPVMMAKSFAALARWRADGFDVPRIGLNVTAPELRDPAFADTILFDLDRVGLAPSDLNLEILESALIDAEDDPVLATIARLSGEGCGIDLDDFGTGHASLSNLRRLAVDRLKIDRSFVRDLHVRPELCKLTRAIVDLAETLGKRAVAEGIETEEELRHVIALGCHELQGFAIGEPMSAGAVPAWVETHRRRCRAGLGIAAA